MNPNRVEDDLIFIRVVTSYPASGLRYSTSGAFNVTGSNGYAWHCAITGVNGYYLAFSSVAVHPTGSYGRACGFPVRCVQHLHLFKL
jgi:hypothetical protein